jgi:hypothetical protein
MLWLFKDENHFAERAVRSFSKIEKLQPASRPCSERQEFSSPCAYGLQCREGVVACADYTSTKAWIVGLGLSKQVVSGILGIQAFLETVLVNSAWSDELLYLKKLNNESGKI